MTRMKSILFVCTGNTCRSVMAEALMKRALEKAGKREIAVGSAGIAAAGGVPPTDETIEVMNELGVDVTAHRATELSDALIEDSDLILVMEDVHRQEILRRVPGAAEKTFLLKEYAYPGGVPDRTMYGVQDPIGWGIGYYRHTRDVINREIERIALTV